LAGDNRHIALNNVPHPAPLNLNPRHSWVRDCELEVLHLRDVDSFQLDR
jgi:hypothetical protein